MADVEDTNQESVDGDAVTVEIPQAPPSAGVEGLVIAIAHGFFEVTAGEHTYLCTLRGRLRNPYPARQDHPQRPQLLRRGRPASFAQSRPFATGRREQAAVAGSTIDDQRVRIAPGDRVLMTPLTGGQGIIEDVSPRRTVLSRARSESAAEHIMLANLDHAVLVFAVQDPTPHFGMLDRYLSLCEHASIDVTICLNKVDLDMPDEVSQGIDTYAALGYRVLMTSAARNEGIDGLRERLHGRTSLLTGPSGVGKSSLMNVLLPEAKQRTAAISESTGKGRHTTTSVRLLPLPDGGWLADSAGIRELALWNVSSEELPATFVELRPYVGQCVYDDCDHSFSAEGCALRSALSEGHITPARFAGFERLLTEARASEQPRW